MRSVKVVLSEGGEESEGDMRRVNRKYKHKTVCLVDCLHCSWPTN